jgi:hypothetical protein
MGASGSCDGFAGLIASAWLQRGSPQPGKAMTGAMDPAGLRWRPGWEKLDGLYVKTLWREDWFSPARSDDYGMAGPKAGHVR